MGFFEELFGAKQDEMPRGVIVHNVKTPYKAQIMAHFEASMKQCAAKLPIPIFGDWCCAAPAMW